MNHHDLHLALAQVALALAVGGLAFTHPDRAVVHPDRLVHRLAEGGVAATDGSPSRRRKAGSLGIGLVAGGLGGALGLGGGFLVVPALNSLKLGKAW